MDTRRAIDYLETVASAGIELKDMPKPMFRLLRSSARLLQSHYPVGLNGYYGPAPEGPVAEPFKYLFRPARTSEKIPRSNRLWEMMNRRRDGDINDPWAVS